MIKINVTTAEHDGGFRVKCIGTVDGERYILAHEMASILKEFHSIDDGKILIAAFDELMGGLLHDTCNG